MIIKQIKLTTLFLPLFISTLMLMGQIAVAQNEASIAGFGTQMSSPQHYGVAAPEYFENSKEPEKSGLKLQIADTFKVDLVRYWPIAIGYYNHTKRILPLYEVSDELMVDKDWISSHDYFAIWDSKKVNPYEFNPLKYDGSVTLDLLDNKSEWISPIGKEHAEVNSNFGMRRYRWHYGVDLDLERGDSVKAVADGIVRIAQYDRYGYGHYVVLRHKNGLETLYGHFLARNVRVGQEVKRGDVIGLGGSTGRSTGYHLHFEIRYKGAAIDPATIYDFDENSLLNKQFIVDATTFQYIKELNKKKYHRIRPGDTLGHISMRYHTSINTICRLNGISRNKVLRVGRTIRVK